MPVEALGLIERGYFPRELPPAFTTAALAAASGLVLPDRMRSDCVRHNLARVNGFRRPLKVPNPINLVDTARVIEQLWPVIDAHFASSELSMSRPVPSDSGRALTPHYRFSEQPRFRARHRAGARFILKTDISQCYSSIYTHSIPWALHGKAHAKSHAGTTDGDQMDRALRNSMVGQTIGIPIGPDTSLVAAEIILTGVDRELQDKLGDVKGFRYLDDYELCFRSRTEAERAQVCLESALADYELAINPAKTRVLELPQPLDELWPHRLQTFAVRSNSNRATVTDLIAMFSLAESLAGTNPGAIKYTLQRARGIPIPKNAWEVFQDLVWGTVCAEPTAAATAIDLLRTKADELSVQVARRPALETIETLITTNAPVRNSSEVTWALWGAIVFGLDLSADAMSAVCQVEDDFVALLALHASFEGRFGQETLDTSTWETLVSEEDALRGSHWLLAYEAGQRKWLTQTPDTDDPFWGSLADQNVEFYVDDVESWDPFSGPSAPLPGSPLSPDPYP